LEWRHKLLVIFGKGGDMGEVVKRGAVGAWLTRSQNPDMFLLLPLLFEDVGKKEWVNGYGSELSLGMLGTITGAAKPGESGLGALRREAWWERGVVIADSQATQLPGGITVFQRRNGSAAEFEVVTFELALTGSQVSGILEQSPIVEVSKGQMENFLADVGHEAIRPCVLALVDSVMANNYFEC